MLKKISLIGLTPFALSFTLSAADGFFIQDGQLMDAKGYAFVMRGASVPFAWFDADSYNALSALASLKANTIRIVWQTNKPANRLDQIMQRCIELKMIPVPELHDATGSDDASSLNNCANYWARSDVKNVLAKYRKQVIVNIANEWMGTWGKNAEYKAAYKNAISIMRNAGINSTLLVDAGGWGQDYTYVLNNGLEILAADPLQNILFAVHMYGQYGTAAKVQTAIHGILNKKIPLIIGEFGWNHSDGDVDEATIISECNDHNVGFLAWSWKGNSGGVEYLDLSSSWTSTTSLSDWGKTVFTSANGIGATSKVCAIFTNVPPVGLVSDRPVSPFYFHNLCGMMRVYSLTGRLLGTGSSSRAFARFPMGVRIVTSGNSDAKRMVMVINKTSGK